MPASTTPAIVKIYELSALTPKTIRYTPTELRCILHDYEDLHDHHYKIMPINAIKSVRNLGLNCKRRRHKYTAQKRREAKCEMGPRSSNLIRIKKDSNRSDTNIIIGTCNTQSIHNKDLQVSDLLDDYSIDLLIITETWLTDKEMDKQWIETTPLNRQPYQLHIHNRVNGRGSGVALITKSYFDVKKNSMWVIPFI